jgi:hypothetical protein
MLEWKSVRRKIECYYDDAFKLEVTEIKSTRTHSEPAVCTAMGQADTTVVSIEREQISEDENYVGA